MCHECSQVRVFFALSRERTYAHTQEKKRKKEAHLLVHENH